MIKPFPDETVWSEVYTQIVDNHKAAAAVFKTDETNESVSSQERQKCKVISDKKTEVESKGFRAKTIVDAQKNNVGFWTKQRSIGNPNIMN